MLNDGAKTEVEIEAPLLILFSLDCNVEDFLDLSEYDSLDDIDSTFRVSLLGDQVFDLLAESFPQVGVLGEQHASCEKTREVLVLEED